MLDQNTIDRIIETAKIEEVVSDYVSLRRRGTNQIGLCPFHNEKTPSFTVSPAKGIFKCFGCGKGGNAVNFLMEAEQIRYYDALRHLAKKYNIEIVEKELTAEELEQRNDREAMLVLNEFARTYFSNILHEHVEGKSIGLSYFRERGFNEDIIKKFQLGYSLDVWNAFAREALKHGYKKEFLEKTGLAFEKNGSLIDRFHGRVMFPVHSLSGKVVAFGGRVLKKTDKTGKYVNSPESEVYHKSRELYGIYFAKNAIVKHDRCYLVEGYTDVISMHQAGIENVVSSSGTSLTQGQIRLVHRFTQNLTLIYDGDAAGIKASLRGIDMLLEEGMNIKVVLLPEGEDPDSFAKKQNASDFIAYIEKNSADFIRFKTNLLLEDAGNDPIKRAALITDIVRSIAVIPDAIIRSVYIKECSSLMNIDEKALYTETTKTRRQLYARPENERAAAENDEVDAAAFTTTVATPQIVEEGLYHKEEREILYYVVRYGETLLPSDPPMSVADYIAADLAADNITLSDPLHMALLQEACAGTAKPDFAAEKYFLNHPNPNISRLAIDLATDKHTLCTSQAEQLEKDADRLHNLVPYAICVLKNKIIIERIKAKMLELKAANDRQDLVRLEEVMREISELNELKGVLAKTLGERIIIKL